MQGPGNLNPAPAPTLKFATQEPLSIQYLSALGQPMLLAGPYLPYLGVKIAGHYDDVFVALSVPLAAPGSASGFYTGVLNLNTTEFQAALGDVAGATNAETDSIPLMGEVVVQVDTAGNLARSQTFSITGQNRVVTGSEGVPVSANPAYPSAAAVIAAIAQAAAADTVAARNAAIATALAALPAPVDTSAALIQPFSLCLEYEYQFNSLFPVYTVGPITFVDPRLVTQSANAQNLIGDGIIISITLASLPLDNVNGILAGLDYTGFYNINLTVTGGTTSPPTLDVAQVSGTGTLDFGAFDISFTADGGQFADVGFGSLSLFFDNSQPFSASGSGTIGVQDNPTGEQIAAYIAANYATSTLTLSGAGSVLSVTDATAAYLPLTFNDDAATGTVSTITQAGNPPANSHAMNIRARGGTVLTN